MRKVKKSSADPRSLGAQCDSCPLRDCPGPVFDEGPDDAELAIIGEGPGHKEVDMGRPFVGASGEKLDSLLAMIGVPRSKVLIANATLEMPPGGNLEEFLALKKRQAKKSGGTFVDPVDCCRPRLFRVLGVPRCRTCGRHQLGPEPCHCKRPNWVHPGRISKLRVVMPLGNASLRALTGWEGIMDWRGSMIDVERFRLGQVQAAVAGRRDYGDSVYDE